MLVQFEWSPSKKGESHGRRRGPRCHHLRGEDGRERGKKGSNIRAGQRSGRWEWIPERKDSEREGRHLAVKGRTLERTNRVENSFILQTCEKTHSPNGFFFDKEKKKAVSRRKRGEKKHRGGLSLRMSASSNAQKIQNSGSEDYKLGGNSVEGSKSGRQPGPGLHIKSGKGVHEFPEKKGTETVETSPRSNRKAQAT